jgi:hypothetical protein
MFDVYLFIPSALHLFIDVHFFPLLYFLSHQQGRAGLHRLYIPVYLAAAGHP